MSARTPNAPTADDDVLLRALPHGASTRFFDRFYFNLHAPVDPLPLLMVGLGVYPGKDVIDGWIIRVAPERQYNHRFATTLSNSDGHSVGPLSFETLEPLCTWRLVIGPNPTGIECDVVWRRRAEPWATERIHLVAPSGEASDFAHFFQSGSYSGSLSLDGQVVDIDGWLGTRDRSRGVRLVTEGGGLHLWVQAQFADRAIAFLFNEDREHQTTHCDGAVLGTDGSVDVVTAVQHDLRFDQNLDFQTGSLAVHTGSGATYHLDVDGMFGGGYLSGGGYGGWHGQPRGVDHSEAETWELDGSISPRTLDVPLTDRPARFVAGEGTVGAGVFEFAVTRSPKYTYQPTGAARTR